MIIINDIEYAIRLWVDDDDGNEICDEVFYSFEEMNYFLNDAFHNEKYDDLTAQFSFVEIINGVPEEAVRFIYEISPIMELSPEEIEEYNNYFLDDINESKRVSESINQQTKFIPKADAEDYISKRKHRDEITYICPFCFRELDDCRCNVYSYTLVQVDKLIVPVIRTLNQKGYITTACCNGHAYDPNSSKIYIAFREDHKFGANLPEGALYSKESNMVFFNWPESLSTKERTSFQEECIDRLLNWVNNLPYIK